MLTLKKKIGSKQHPLYDNDAHLQLSYDAKTIVHSSTYTHAGTYAHVHTTMGFFQFPSLNPLKDLIRLEL